MTPRTGAELVRATQPFAREDRARTWRLFLATVLFQAAAVAATIALPLALKPLGTLLVALLIVRLFMFLHDAEHGAIFVGDRLGRAAVWAVGVITMNTLPLWSKAHDRHHRTNGEPLDPPLTAYLPGDLLNRTVTVAQWRALSPAEKKRCRRITHPLVMVFGFFTAFVFGHGIAPYRRDRDTRGLVTLALWLLVLAALVAAFGPVNAAFAYVFPNLLSSTFGVYLFFAQHHFPAARIPPHDRWDVVDAALTASSFMEMPAWLHWFTADIAWHHVHHVNHRIPFYRLREAMAAIPELQNPGRTSFHPREIAACLRCNVWDPDQGRLVSFDEADGIA